MRRKRKSRVRADGGSNIGQKTAPVRFVKAENVGNLIDKVQKFVEAYISENGGTVDYIHDLSAVSEFTTKAIRLGFWMPPMDKSELLKTVAENGVFPKKSFSIGHAKDKK